MKQKYWLLLFRIATGITLVAITYLSLIPSPPMKGSPSDKINHFIAYGVLSFLGLLAGGKTKGRRIYIILFFCIIWGIVMEFIQKTTGRYFELYDMMANTIGIFCGYGLFQISKFISQKIIRR